jgi:hypothetical protein
MIAGFEYSAGGAPCTTAWQCITTSIRHVTEFSMCDMSNAPNLLRQVRATPCSKAYNAHG